MDLKHRHSPSNKFGKDAVWDLFCHLKERINTQNGLSQCAFCNTLLSPPHFNFDILRRIALAEAPVGLLFGFIARLISPMISANQIHTFVWIIGFHILMAPFSYCVRRLVLCHYLVTKDWDAHPELMEQKELDSIRTNFKNYRYFLSPFNIIYSALPFLIVVQGVFLA